LQQFFIIQMSNLMHAGCYSDLYKCAVSFLKAHDTGSEYNDLYDDTDAGDENLFSTLEKNLLQAIPVDVVEWRRSFSRPIKQVKLEATFVPFSRDILPTDKDWHLIEQPIFHIYWTECSVSYICHYVI